LVRNPRLFLVRFPPARVLPVDMQARSEPGAL
jgi:hypothetical protein